MARHVQMSMSAKTAITVAVMPTQPVKMVQTPVMRRLVHAPPDLKGMA